MVASMRARRAICVSRDEGVRRVVAQALAEAGVAIEHADALPADCSHAALVVVDRATRQQAGERLRSIAAPVVVVGDDLDDDGLITLMLEQPVSHLVEDPSDRRLGVTSAKLASGDVFGIEKYLAEGATIGERSLRAEDDRRRTIDEVCAWAETVGARKPVIHRITSVVDELLMNAQREATPAPEGTGAGAAARRVVVRWACDGETLAISVGDGLGTLRQRDIIDHLRRARADRGRPQPEELSASGGAGLGLYLVLANVASLVVNVAAGRRTEVVCLFELAPRSQPAVGAGVRSLHVFHTVS